MTSYVSRLPMPKQRDEDKEDKTQQWAKWQSILLDQGYNEPTVSTLARYRNQDKIDYDLVAHVIKHITESGETPIDNGAQPAILVFMPGKTLILCKRETGIC